MTDTIFQQIIDKTIPAEIVYEDELCLAFHDLMPKAPIHILIIPKQGITQISHATADDQALLGHLLLSANHIAKEFNTEDGFRLVINNGAKGGQSVFHLHVHLLGGRVMEWPPG